jgi:hypothetical protein
MQGSAYIKNTGSTESSLFGVQVHLVEQMPIDLEEYAGSSGFPVKSNDFDVNIKASLPQSDLPQHEEESHALEEGPVSDTPKSLQDLVVNERVDREEVTSLLHAAFTDLMRPFYANIFV